MNKTHPFGETTLIQTLSYQIIRMYCLEQDFISRRQGREGGREWGLRDKSSRASLEGALLLYLYILYHPVWNL